MKQTVNLIIVLLALSTVNAAGMRGPLARTKQMQSLMEIDAHPLGNIVMSQLQLHLAADGMIGDVLRLIDELSESIRNEQTEADQAHNMQRAQCNELLPEYESKVNHHTKQSEVSAKRVVDTGVLLTDADTQLGLTIAAIDEYSGLLVSGQDTRDQEEAAFAIAKAKAQQAMEALDEAISLISSMQQGRSFIQVKSRIQEVTTKLQEMEHLTKYTMYAPIIEALVQVATTTEPSAIVKILKLLRQLRDSIQHTAQQEALLEKSRISAWTQTKSDLTNQKNNAIDRKGSLENSMVNFRQIIGESEQAVIDHDAEAGRFATLFDTQTRVCDEEQVSYDTATASRDSDLDILRRLKEYMEQNVATLENYMLERVN